MERPDRYSPLFSVDTRNGDILWELWIEGFEKAVALRPAAWMRKKVLDADVDTAAAMSGMLLLADIVRGENEVDDRDTILAAAPDKIADWAVILNEWRLANTQPVKDIDPRVPCAPSCGRSQTLLYNILRPHSSLGNVPPAVYADRHAAKPQRGKALRYTEGSAPRPVASPSLLGSNENRTLLIGG